MAFGGAAVNKGAGKAADGKWQNRIIVTGLTLAARAGAFGVAAADSGRLTTDQTPPANETALTPAVGSAFGPGEAKWVAGDEDTLDVEVRDTQDGANSSEIKCVGRRVNAGNLELDFHNNGAGASAGLEIVITKTSTLTH